MSLTNSPSRPGAGGRITPPHEDWVDEEVESVLTEPYNYITQVPGKEIRTLLINAFNVWMDCPEDKLDIIKESTKMLHNASLLIDDIQDNSKLRRGVPVAHAVFGVATTINTANYVYFQCLQKVVSTGEPKAATIFAEQLCELHRGQGMDIHWRDTSVCPTEAQYKEMVQRKTGGLFGLAVRLMQCWSTSTEDFSKVLDLLGLHFQIRDDYANLKSAKMAENKSFAEDLTEGKFSFPIIHSIRATAGNGNRQLLSILRQRTEDDSLKRFACELVEKSGSFEYTRKTLLQLEEELLAEIARLGGNPLLVKTVEKLSLLYKEE